MRIVSIKDKRVKALVDNPEASSVRGFDPMVTGKVRDMLSVILAMTHPLQLGAVPSWKAHELTPKHPGKWALVVTRNYRLTFYVDVDRQEVSILDYEDYH